MLEQFEDSEVLPQDTRNRYNRYRDFIKYIECWGKDSLTSKKLSNYLEKIRLNKPSTLFDESLYLSFKRYLLPPYHQVEEGKKILYSKEQTELIRSENNPRRKIKGVAGSGKTLVLARRAVNAYLRTESTILILTYNLSLKNYIHDRISDVREYYPWDKFYITNYHQFFKSEANNYGLEIKSLSPFTDTKFFEPVKEKIEKYRVILIDEVQDYKTEWLEIIHTYFLEENEEFVVFGDEKQNIYNRPLDDNKEPKTIGIRGTWNKSLNTSRRFTNRIGLLAMNFQHYFLEQKYTIDEIQILDNPTLNFEQEYIKYANIGTNSDALSIYKIYVGSVRKFNIHPSDVTILSSKIEILRDIEYHINTQLKENTTTTFETKEEYEKCKASCQVNDSEFKKRIDNIRRNKKNHFWMKTGTVKLSSIHSYKGWESHTVMLIIEPEDESTNNEPVELIYTAITRAQVNLFILNMGNDKFDSFFKENIQN
ncbi:UvrD-helicase domain-containing protein [Bacteroides fragilis]|uniref:UvrD-helicase domain-containing protein n=1 Tax=Bacteroides fragilis TaxID=817 RepID=UPI00202F1296|nr:UvrD-helicase domain-containing protein [Bacteroides fragilis]